MKLPTKKALLALKPCEEGAKFIKSHKSLRQAWAKCRRAEWMIWALNNLGLWDDKTARTFDVECAEHVLHFFEDKYPEDKRPRQAIEAARHCITDNSDAAWADAARAAENKWQADKLRELINPWKNGIANV